VTVKFDADSVLPFPQDVVFRAYRDQLQLAVPYMPNHVSIEVRSEQEVEPGVRRYFKVWTAAGEIPASLRAFLSEGVLRWDDVAVWSEKTWASEWEIRTHLFPEAVQCSGRTLLIALGPERTRVEMHGALSIDHRKIASVPDLVARPLIRTAEAYLTRQVTANLASTADAITRFLREKQ
jgi:hypothetical protein